MNWAMKCVVRALLGRNEWAGMEKLTRPVSQICFTEASSNPLRAIFSADFMTIRGTSLLSCRVSFYAHIQVHRYAK